MSETTAPACDVDPAILAALVRLGLLEAEATPAMAPLAGGVSSDIWRVAAGGRVFCVKRALEKLKVAKDWRVPVTRSRYEYLWLEEAARHAPGSVPALLGYDEEAGLFALEWLEPATHKWWKGELRDGRVDVAAAAALGRALARIHAGTAGRADIAARFATDDIFFAIRLEPYLLATAQVHADLAEPLAGLVATTAETRLVLVHGDVSPKNIMIGPRGPILLDAECAWYGDPAFDIAFCLNHLLLKCLWTPSARDQFLRAFAAMAAAYLAGVTWEPPVRLEARAARLLPGLLLARVDGKSPVEYLTRDDDKAVVRRSARALLVEPADRLETVTSAWRNAIARTEPG